VDFTVEGSGEFPDDMLRYDRCYPAEQEDIFWMNGKGKRSVRMSMIAKYKNAKPTIARWNSFGWSVDLIKEMKI
jgi:hypothetical protein